MKKDKSTVQFTEVKGRPEIGKKFSMVQCGIRTKEGAEAWGTKYGFTQVYWCKSEEKVYGVKSIADEAQDVKDASVDLLAQAELMA